MQYYVISFILVFAPSSLFAESKCSWRQNYGKNYFDSRKVFFKPEGIVRKQLESNIQYLYLSRLKTPSVAELAEKAAFEKGLTDRHAYLKGIEAAGTLSKTQKLELFAYDETGGNVEAGRLAVQLHSLNTIEKARYEALMATRGDFRAAFLAEQNARGLLKSRPAERAELQALLVSRGDARYAQFKKSQLEGHKLNSCDLEELAYIESAVKPTSNAEATHDNPPEEDNETGGNVL